MKAIEAYDSAYPGSMSKREDGSFIRREDADSLAGALLAMVKSGDRAAEDLQAALIAEGEAAARYLAALAALISGDVGRQTLAKLAAGQGTDTDDGRAWLRAAEMVRPNAELTGRASAACEGPR